MDCESDLSAIYYSYWKVWVEFILLIFVVLGLQVDLSHIFADCNSSVWNFHVLADIAHKLLTYHTTHPPQLHSCISRWFLSPWILAEQDYYYSTSEKDVQMDWWEERCSRNKPWKERWKDGWKVGHKTQYSGEVALYQPQMFKSTRVGLLMFIWVLIEEQRTVGAVTCSRDPICLDRNTLWY